MSGVEIRVRANAAQAQREIQKTGRSIKGLETQAADLTKTFRRMAMGLTVVFGGVGLTKSINGAADAMIGLNNRVKLVTKDATTTQKTIKDLFDIAARSGGSIDAAAETFNRFGLALRDSNKPVGELLKVTEAVQKAAIISGSGAESAKAAIIQLGQGLASGQLRGQELNSVLEQMPRLAQSIAEGMGIPFGKLREEAAAGKITAEAVFQALLDGAEKIDQEFATLQFTTSDLATVMQNELTRAIAEFDKVSGFSDAFKRKILSLTKTFRFVGENIARWALNVELAFLIAESQAKDFIDTFKSLFSENFNASDFANSIVDSVINTFESAKERVKEAFLNLFGEKSFDEFGDEVKIAPKFEFSTADLFSGFDTALAVFTTFKDNVIRIFTELYDRLFTKSLWTGMFIDSHRERGALLSFGSDITAFMAKPLAAFGKFKDDFIKFATELYDSSTQQWANTVEYFNKVRAEPRILDKDIRLAYKNSVEELEGRWTQFTDFVTNKKPEPTFAETLTATWDTAVGNMNTRWSTFVTTIGAAPPIDDSFTAKLKTNFDAVILKMGETYDEFVSGISDGDEQTYPTFDSITTGFNSAMDKLKNIFKDTVDIITSTPIFILVSTAAENISINFDSIKESIDEYFATNEAALSAAVTAGIALAFKPELLKGVMRKGILGGLVAAAALSTDDPEFLESVREAGKGWGQAFASLVSGDGDIIARVSGGLADLLKAAGEGLGAGLFPESMQGTIADNLGTALVGALALFTFTPTLAKSVLNLGMRISRKIFGSTFAASASSKIASGLSTAMLEVQTNPKTANAANALGKVMGNSINAALTSFAVKGISDAVVDDDAMGGLGEAVDGALGGGTLGAQIGLMVGGPLGAAIGGAGGFLLGGLLDVLNNPELVQKIKDIFNNAIDVITTFFTSIPETVGNAMVEGFTKAWEYLSGKLSTIKDFFTGGSDGGSSDQNSLPPVYDGYAKQSNETDEEYKERVGFASGGYVSGPGTGTSDDIPAMLSNGEYVIKTAAVNKIGKTKLDLLNQGILPKFNTGGLVGRARQEVKDSFGRGDTQLALELLSVVEQLGKLDEVTEGLTAEMAKAVTEQVRANNTKEDEDEKAAAIIAFGNDFKAELAGGLSYAIKSGDFKGAITGILDSFTSQIINNFSQNLVESAFEGFDFSNLFAGFGNEGGGLGGLLGGGLSSFFGGIGGFFGFSQGGVVPSTPFSQAGKDSVPAMLMPGEVVLSKNDVRAMDANRGSGQQVFNINVSGDVSRQTRKEIVKMMPQITGGVNAQNRESNFKR
jgi:tape measure domain-containing protein